MLGLKSYLETPVKLAALSENLIWQEGTSVVRDYGTAHTKKDAPLALFIPSLINRANILDLLEDNSLLRYLADESIHPLLLDWQEPGEIEGGFTMEDYVLRVLRAVAALKRQFRRPVVLVGYCMGGLIALAASLFAPSSIKALGLLATPWDFHAPDVRRTAFSPSGADSMAALFAHTPLVPHALLHTIFYSLNPWGTHDKFRRIAALNDNDPLKKLLIAREYWANTGVDMPRAIAHTTFVDWACHNRAFLNEWKMDGRTIIPGEVKVPAFVAIPKHDPVVPPKCAEPLTLLLPDARKVSCVSGHIGMIAGKNARRDLWIPLANWLHSL